MPSEWKQSSEILNEGPRVRIFGMRYFEHCDPRSKRKPNSVFFSFFGGWGFSKRKTSFGFCNFLVGTSFQFFSSSNSDPKNWILRNLFERRLIEKSQKRLFQCLILRKTLGFVRNLHSRWLYPNLQVEWVLELVRFGKRNVIVIMCISKESLIFEKLAFELGLVASFREFPWRWTNGTSYFDFCCVVPETTCAINSIKSPLNETCLQRIQSPYGAQLDGEMPKEDIRCIRLETLHEHPLGCLLQLLPVLVLVLVLVLIASLEIEAIPPAERLQPLGVLHIESQTALFCEQVLKPMSETEMEWKTEMEWELSWEPMSVSWEPMSETYFYFWNSHETYFYFWNDAMHALVQSEEHVALREDTEQEIEGR